MLRWMEGLPLPAEHARHPNEINLDGREELTGEVSVSWIPNQASRGFFPRRGPRPDTTGYLVWKQIQKRIAIGGKWRILGAAEEQKGNSGDGDNDFPQAIEPDSISISDLLHAGMRGSESSAAHNDCFDAHR